MECSHAESNYRLRGFDWTFACESCGLSTEEHARIEDAAAEWRKISRPWLNDEAIRNMCEAILLKRSVGERLSPSEEAILAYGYFRPSCHHPR